MKRIILASITCLGFITQANAQDSGAFSAVVVTAKDPKAYVDTVKSNPTLFKTLGAIAAGQCTIISGQDRPGQLYIWTAYPNAKSALKASTLYDPNRPAANLAAQRDYMYSFTVIPIKPFATIDPGYERASRVKISSANLPAFVATSIKLEREIQAAGFTKFQNAILVPLGGGQREAGTIFIKSLMPDSESHGALIDAYFAGAAWGETYRKAMSLVDEVVNDQFEVCEQFYKG
ncbi:hypothetical protein [Sphingorhabdus sp.]|jgi:hypothetical protein|uniref:hypothetical protein n=1 Tax=Sphingorhabdus sp. TaxID=1902408 RepID=UPI0040489D06